MLAWAKSIFVPNISVPLWLLGIICILILAVILLDLKQRRVLKRKAKIFASARERLKDQQQALLRLVLTIEKNGADLAHVEQQILREAATIVNVERVGLWFFDESRAAIKCKALYHRSTDTFTNGELLHAKNYPGYFKAINENRVIVADDAEHDLSTYEFKDNYLKEHKIRSMLDAPVRLDGKLVGIVCHEHVGFRRNWLEDEIAFAASVADMTAMAHELTRRREGEAGFRQELKEQQDLLSTIINSLPSHVYVRAADSSYVMVNNVTADAFKLTAESIKGRRPTDLFTDKDLLARMRAEDLEILKTGRDLIVPEELVPFPDGTERWFHVVKKLIKLKESYVLGVSTDITERKALNEKLIQSQRMDAIGQLAGGIAHDFNNILTGILGYTNLLTILSKDAPQIVEPVRSIQKAAVKAEELTRQLLGFARRGKHQHLQVNIHTVISDVIALSARTIESDIDFKRSLHAPNSSVMGDPVQLEQVILNLVINARDAILTSANKNHLSQRGLIEVTTNINFLNGIRRKELAGLPVGLYLTIAVSDNGCGMSSETARRIFEPFFTTKEQGTGMGLAMVYGIIDNHGGAVCVDSQEGAGSTFSVYLPLLEGVVAAVPEARVGLPIEGNGIILLIDDHEIIRDATSKMLESLGYIVLVAADGEEALHIMQRQSIKNINISAVILDMVMPRMSAQDTVAGIKQIRPDVPIILSTGYGHNHAVQELLENGVTAFIQKPYQLQQLSEIVAGVLGSKAEAEQSSGKLYWNSDC